LLFSWEICTFNYFPSGTLNQLLLNCFPLCPAFLKLTRKQVTVNESTNEWNHLALRWTAGSKTVSVFVNGIYNNHVLDVADTSIARAGTKLEIEQTPGDTAGIIALFCDEPVQLLI